MQSAGTTPLNKLETHYAVCYANCTHCASEKQVMQYSEHIMHYAEGILHMYASQRVQADFLTEEMSHEGFCIFCTKAKGMNGSFRDVRV